MCVAVLHEIYFSSYKIKNNSWIKIFCKNHNSVLFENTVVKKYRETQSAPRYPPTQQFSVDIPVIGWTVGEFLNVGILSHVHVMWSLKMYVLQVESFIFKLIIAFK